MQPVRRHLIMLALVAALLTCTPPAPAFATGTIGDGTAASCSEAELESALTEGGPWSFDCGPSPVTITFTSGKVIVANTLLDGGGLITLSGGGGSAIFTVYPGVSLELQNLSLVQGSTFSNNEGDSGAVIYTAGHLRIDDSSFTGNKAGAGSPGSGGALYMANGTTLVRGSIFESNSNVSGPGGAISNAGGVLTVLDSTMDSNNAAVQGGAIYNHAITTISGSTLHQNDVEAPTSAGGGFYNDGGTLTVTDSDVTFNGANGQGGAIWNGTGGTTTITASALSSNSAGQGGAIWNDGGSVTITGSSVTGSNAASSAGAIYNNDTMAISMSTVDGGRADIGGGIYHNAGALTIDASTLSNNSGVANQQGGGLYIGSGQVTVSRSTFNANDSQQGGAIYNAGGVLDIVASTLSGNSAAEGGAIYNNAATTIGASIVSGNGVSSCSGSTPVTSLGFNVNDSPPCASSTSGDAELLAGQPMGALADNGGPTGTMLPASNSYAINHTFCLVSSPDDQRGAARPASGTNCDMGAVEVGPLVPVQLLAVYDASGPIDAGDAATVTARATGPAGVTFAYAFDCDDDGSYETAGGGTGTMGRGSCSFSDYGIFTVGARACDAADNTNCAVGTTTMTVGDVILGAPPPAAPLPSGERQVGQTVVEPAYDDADGSIMYLITSSKAHENANYHAVSPLYIIMYPISAAGHVGTTNCAHQPEDNCADHGPELARLAASQEPGVYGPGVWGHDHIGDAPGGSEFNVAWGPVVVLFTNSAAANIHITTEERLAAAVSNGDAIEMPLPEMTFLAAVVSGRVYEHGIPLPTAP